jgi:5-methyltetrahydropteroyltriglutamate--homocysteine methyltransferase
MFTATADLLLPTTVTGSWPRPRWYDGRLDGRALSTRMKDVAYREQFTDALAVLLDEQERAGLDVVTHGDYFHDEDIGGHQWIRYPLERWSGLHGDYTRVSPELPSFEPGAILNEIFAGWRWPKVVGKIEPNEDTPLEYAKIWRLAQSRTTKPVKFGSVCAHGLNPLLDVVEGYDQDDRRELMWDLSTAMNQELRQLAAGGCTVIQIEEPLLHYLAMYHPERTDLIDFLVEAFNHEVSGLDDVEVWVHTCWGNPNMQRAMDNVSYANSIEIYLDRLNADVWTVEMKDAAGAELPLFKPWKDTMKKKVAVGVVSHRNLQVETPEEVAAMTREALKYINPENLILSTDCGFGRQGANRLIAYYKAAAIALGANIVRRELGAEERYVPAADGAMQVDVTAEQESRLFAGFSGQGSE